MLLRLLLAGLFSCWLSACPSHGSDVTVRVVSDFVPGPEVTLVETELMDGPVGPGSVTRETIEKSLRYGMALSRGIDVASFYDVPAGEIALKVTLKQRDGTRLGGRIVAATITGSRTVVVHITRDCARVVCPGAGNAGDTACLAGRCVDPRCTAEDRTYCPEDLFCNNELDCSVSSTCATGSCNDGVCVLEPREDACDAELEWCSPGGCAPIEGPTMPGGPDERCGRICTLPGEPCRYGYYVCTETNAGLDVTCTAFVARPIGSPCGSGSVCDEAAECVTPMDGGVADASIVDASTLDASRDASTLDASRDASTLDASRDARADATEMGPPVDPCDPNPCGLGTCAPSGGTYACTCPSGYGAPPTGGTCADVDECELGTDACADSEVCVDEDGAYFCAALRGIVGGEMHACAYFERGQIRCWGYASDSLPAPLHSTRPQREIVDAATGSGSLFMTTLYDDGRLFGESGEIDFGGTAVRVAAGGTTLCVVLTDGGVSCWGTDNADGRLGYGDTDARAPGSEPIALGGPALDVAVGDYHACALLADGSVECWGHGGNGALGYGDNMTRYAPSGAVNLGRPAVAIATSAYGTCAALDDGTMKCWGFWANAIPTSNAPGAPMPLGAGATSMSAGSYHVCAALDDGTMKCWGENYYGALGYGDSVARSAPDAAPIDFGGREVSAIGTGRSASCALFDDGSATCWGRNETSMLGYGDVSDAQVPAAALDFGAGRTAVQLAVGGQHSCALLDDGTLSCWGANTSGQLGLGDRNGRPVPTQVALPPGVTPDSLYAGEEHTCVREAGGELTCWGYASAFGGSGFVTTPPATPIDLGAGRTSTLVSTGYQSTCALLDDGSARCFDLYGGVPSTFGVPTMPAPSSLRVGYGNALFSFADGSLRGLGANANGELGYGDTSARTAVPTDAVSFGPRTVHAVAYDYRSACAVLDDGALSCWGNNDDGQLGYGDTMRRTAPGPAVNVGGGRTVTRMDVGYSHTCAVLDDGSVKCWGLNHRSMLGYGSWDTTLAPRADALDLGGVRAGDVGVGFYHACALLEDGTVRCWGNNDYGQIGVGMPSWSPRAEGIDFRRR